MTGKAVGRQQRSGLCGERGDGRNGSCCSLVEQKGTRMVMMMLVMPMRVETMMMKIMMAMGTKR